MPIVTAALNPNEPVAKQLSDGSGTQGGANGTILGVSATDQVSFFGAAPIPQPGSLGSLRGAAGTVTIYAVSLSPTAVAANTAAEQALTVTGVAVGQLVLVNKPTSQAGLALATARVSAANTIQATFANDTAGSITPTATETYFITAIPASMLNTAVLTPAAVAPNTTVEQRFNVPGIAAGAAVAVNKPTAQAGLAILGARVVSAGVLGITFANVTAAAITPTAGESYLVFAQAGISVAPVEQVLSAALTPASVAANTTAEQTFTVPGLPAGTAVFVNKPSNQPGLAIGGARVSALNTLAITFVNDSAAAIVPTAGEVYAIGSFPTAAPAAGSSTAFVSVAGGSDHAALVQLGLVGGP